MQAYEKTLELYINRDKERNVITCIYQYGHLAEKMLMRAMDKGLEPKHFYDIEIGVLYEKAVDRTLDGKTVSLMDLPNKHLETDLIDETSFISDILDLIELYEKRNVFNGIYSSIALLEQEDVEGAKTHIERIFDNAPEREKTIHDIDIYQIYNNPNTQKGIPSYFTQLDKIRFEFLPGNLYAIGANTGAGKTTFALNAMVRQMEHGNNVLMFSIEQTMEDIYLRLLPIVSGFSKYQITEGKADSQRVFDADALIKNHCEIVDTSIVSTRTMEMKAKIIHKRKPLSLIVVDLWQLIHNGGNSYMENLISSADGLLAMAKNLQVPIIVIAQVDKNSSRMERLDRNAFSGSKQLSNNSSYVMMLNKTEDQYTQEKKTVLEIAKSRFPGHGGREIDLILDVATERIML